MEVDPKASIPHVGETRVESRRSREIIDSLRSWAETVTFPMRVIEQTNVLLKEVSGEVVGPTETADEAEPGFRGLSLVNGAMSDHLLGNCAE